MTAQSGGFNAGGGVPRRPSFTVKSHGPCPLDGYTLIEVDGIQAKIGGEWLLLEGGWDHIIPLPSDPASMEAARLRIATAHGFEVSAAAEAIIRDSGG